MPKHILSDYLVSQARFLASVGQKPDRIATWFGVETEELTDAIRGITFKHIANPAPVPAGTLPIVYVAATQDRFHRTRKIDGTRLRTIRIEKLGLSQSQIVGVIQAICEALNYPTRLTKRLYQAWESGEYSHPNEYYRAALVQATGETYDSLCVPVGPADPQHAAYQLAPIIAQVTDLHDQLLKLHAYLVTEASPALQTPN